jgi:hypothetical protein
VTAGEEETAKARPRDDYGVRTGEGEKLATKTKPEPTLVVRLQRSRKSCPESAALRLVAYCSSHHHQTNTTPRATPPSAGGDRASSSAAKERDAGARSAPAVRSVGRCGAVSARRPGPPLRAAPLRRLRSERVPRPGPRLLRRVALLLPPLGLRRGGPRHGRRAPPLLLPAPPRPPARLGLRLALPPAASRRRPRLSLRGGCRNFQFLMNPSFPALDLLCLLPPTFFNLLFGTAAFRV